MGEYEVGGEQTMREPEVQTTLESGGALEVAPLRIDDSPLPIAPRRVDVPPCGDDRVRYGAGHSYSKKRVK